MRGFPARPASGSQSRLLRGDHSNRSEYTCRKDADYDKEIRDFWICFSQKESPIVDLELVNRGFFASLRSTRNDGDMWGCFLCFVCMTVIRCVIN